MAPARDFKLKLTRTIEPTPGPAFIHPPLAAWKGKF
jgi:hypothetical protein